MTQEQVHLRFEIHQRWISNVETGKRNPAYASLRRLAAALDLSTSQLIARAEAIEAAEASEAAEAIEAAEAVGAVDATGRQSGKK